MSIDEKLLVFRQKYPGSSEEQVELYRQALVAEAANPPKPPEPVVEDLPKLGEPEIIVPPAALPEIPPEKLGTDLRAELKEILLGTYGLSLRLSADVQHRIRTEDLTENELLELVFQHT